ncbi:hypothetical protein FB451DRAFT_986403, partial [Mycena latifolia]
TLSLHLILQFLKLSAHLKNDILCPAPSTVSTECTPEILSPSIASFLSDATRIPLADMDTCWDALKNDVWEYPSEALNQGDEQAFIDYRWARGLCKY